MNDHAFVQIQPGDSLFRAADEAQHIGYAEQPAAYPKVGEERGFELFRLPGGEVRAKKSPPRPTLVDVIAGTALDAFGNGGAQGSVPDMTGVDPIKATVLRSLWPTRPDYVTAALAASKRTAR